MGEKMSVLGLIMYFPPYLRSAMVLFPLPEFPSNLTRRRRRTNSLFNWTRRHSWLRGLTSCSCRWLRPSDQAFFPFGQKKEFWCHQGTYISLENMPFVWARGARGGLFSFKFGRNNSTVSKLLILGSVQQFLKEEH